MCKIKKLTGVILLVVLAITIMSFSVSAESSTSIVLSTDKVSVASGDTITVLLSVTGNSKAIQGALSYDANKFDFVSASINTSLTDINKENDTFNPSTGSIAFAVLGNGTQIDGAWLSFTFTTKTIIGTAQSVFNVNNAVSVLDSGKETPNVTKVNVGITSSVKTGALGDLNGDGKVNLLDLVRMKKDLAMSAQVTVVNDLDKNELFNSEDMVIMIRFILGDITL